jgi:arginyl-tRNA--protein-N-Asp/Glu arginylyltransferase
MRPIPPPTADFAIYIAKQDTHWSQREDSDSLEKLYAQGYLPYSGAAGLQGVFYSARSARVALPGFSLSSENRRIAKKFDGQFTKEKIPAARFEPTDGFWSFCLDYFAQKHGKETMPRARLKTILGSGLVSHVIVYKKGVAVAAYVLEVEEGSMGHFWFSFYDLAYAKQSLGLWLMLDCIRDAKARGLARYYLGTVYGEKARYKLNFKPIEWWDLAAWSTDIEKLKRL